VLENSFNHCLLTTSSCSRILLILRSHLFDYLNNILILKLMFLASTKNQSFIQYHQMRYKWIKEKHKFAIKEKKRGVKRRVLNKPCQPFGACVSRLTPIPKHCKSARVSHHWTLKMRKKKHQTKWGHSTKIHNLMPLLYIYNRHISCN
jgi:hypothetical protein